MSRLPVVIVGGGLAGLSCARELAKHDVPFVIIESSNTLGGRLQTDHVDGFLLDRGFQVFLTAYPEAKRILDYEQLDLKSFSPGAIVRADGQFHEFVDPWRKPTSILKTATANIGSIADKFRVAKLRSKVQRATVDDLLGDDSGTTTSAMLSQFGFGQQMVDRFFRPFYGGVFLESELETSQRMMHFTFRMFSEGDATIPNNGMNEIPSQLASQLPQDSIRLNSRVERIDGKNVLVEGQGAVESEAIVIATDEVTASSLVPELEVSGQPRSVRCVYFAAEQAPMSQPMLVLNGEQKGPVNNFCVPSLVSQNYAPDGQHLCSATVLELSDFEEEDLVHEVQRQMQDWFGESVAGWRHLKTYTIPYALPDQTPAAEKNRRSQSTNRDGLYICGDHCENGSINGAMVSGFKTAQAIISAGVPV